MLRILLYRTWVVLLASCWVQTGCELESLSAATPFVGPGDDEDSSSEGGCADQPDEESGQGVCTMDDLEGDSASGPQFDDESSSAEADAGDDSGDDSSDKSAADEGDDADEGEDEGDEDEGKDEGEDDEGGDADEEESTGDDSLCGDGEVEAPETCDGDNFDGRSCADFGHNSGELLCDECELSTELCHTCGDATKDALEVCDVDDFGGATCESLGFAGGVLNCSQDCQTIDTSNCLEPAKCGDGMIEVEEECDGTNLGGASCVSLGFDEGQLSCKDDCSFDRSKCRDRPCRKALQSCGGVNKCCPGLACVLGICI